MQFAKHIFCQFVLVSALLHSVVAVEPLKLMPKIEDQTQMWWADGFPSHTPSARWLRVIQTGKYALALDTETLRVPHFGAVGGLLDDWQKLPSAELNLEITVAGKVYHCRAGGKWTRWGGPRLIESGRFFQRGDVTDLAFTADDGTRLNVEARCETAAWADRLGLILSARPGLQAILPGERSFGRVGGGFGLDGANQLEVASNPTLQQAQFTLEFWVFAPSDYQVSPNTSPWLVCKNAHELAPGNFGITISNGAVAQARLNLGGGTDNAFTTPRDSKQALVLNAWNHLAMSYDGDTLRLFVNGVAAGETKIGRAFKPAAGAMAIGQRQDNFGDGYHFRGVVDEIRLYSRALTLEEIRSRHTRPGLPQPALNPAAEWSFDANGKASMTQLSEQWQQAAMDVRLTAAQGTLHRHWELPAGETWTSPTWYEAALAMDPVAFKTADEPSGVQVEATVIPSGVARPVSCDSALGWHRVNLDGIEPIVPAGDGERRNDAIERLKLVLKNPTDREQVARLLFEKTRFGIDQRIGTAITGISAILRDAKGQPTGIPVQLSKNWHNEPEGGVYGGQWFHGISQVRLPAGANVELELTLAYGHWGGVAAASHAQLSLIGWGSNQLWDQSALGSWGESICYEPDQVQGDCTITDVRPSMLLSRDNNQPWGWTCNVGGGDFFALFDAANNHLNHAAVRTTYHRYGPCLTEVTYAGRIGDGITHSITTSLARTDDLVRGTYRLRLDVSKGMDFSRFVLFQIGADHYVDSTDKKMAWGNETGLVKEWPTQPGGNTYHSPPLECTGRIPWVSLHESGPLHEAPSAWANRGIVFRQWNARLGGKAASPWIAEHSLTVHQRDTSTLDLVPPPGVTRLEAGDFIEATLELVIMPQFSKDYYGPNAALRAALTKNENTWRMIHREVVGNDRQVDMKTGVLIRTHPAITIEATNDQAEFTLTGGLGYVAITFTGLASPGGYTLFVDDQPLNQTIHGNDFWQTDYDPATQRWSLTYNVPADDLKQHKLLLSRHP